MKLSLHTAKRADWEKTKKPNIWQKIASKSGGTLTPANFASLGGGAFALWGLWIIMDGNTADGLILLTIGRFADLADGIIAEYTHTKSPVGETIDATVDKIVVAFTLIVLGALTLIPWAIIAVIGFQNVTNVLISLVAKLRNKTIHPSQLGKVSSAFSWITIILYPLGDLLQHDISPGGGLALKLISLASFGIYIIFGLQASLDYGRLLYKKSGGLYRLFR